MSRWVKTDDMQYLLKRKDGVYVLTEAREIAHEQYCVCKGEVIIANWKDSDGKYDSDLVRIIESYYGTVDAFKKAYKEDAAREQSVAEMIFESMSPIEMECVDVVPESSIEQELLQKAV